MTHLPFCSPLLSPGYPIVCTSPLFTSFPLQSLISPFLANSFPWPCLAAHTQPDCSMFPELIGVTLAWQETQCYYGNAQSITGQRINTPSVIFDSHICVGLMVAMHGCYLLRGILSAPPRGTLQYAWGQLCNCWIVGLPWMRAFPLRLKNLKVHFASQNPILFDFNVQTSRSLNCIPVSSGYLIHGKECTSECISL